MKKAVFLPMISNEKLRDMSDRLSGGRYCFHDSLSDHLHVMLINLPPYQNYPRHKHTNTCEFYVIIEGEMVVDHWDKHGNRTIRHLSLTEEEDFRILKIGVNEWHAVTAGPDGAKFVEFRSGPFDPDSTLFER